MAYTTAQARQQLLERLAAAARELAVALAYLGEAYEQLDEHAAKRLEQELFRPVQTAYTRIRRIHTDFANRHGLPTRSFDHPHPHLQEHDAKHNIDSAVDAIAQADSTLATLQASPLPIEVGNPQLRAGLDQLRMLLAAIREQAHQITRTRCAGSEHAPTEWRCDARPL